MNEVDELYEKIQLADESLPTPNFNQTNVNYPKNPYTNEIYEAGMSTLFHTTKLRGNCLLNAIGVK